MRTDGKPVLDLGHDTSGRMKIVIVREVLVL